MTPRNGAGRREWLLRGVLVLLSVGLTVGLLEVALRVLVDRYRCDDRLGWTYRPDSRVLVFNWTGEFLHFVRFNHTGWRDDREAPAGPDPGAYRIALLGDSFTAGLQVPAERSFPRLLETGLRSRGTQPRRIEVWNAAVDGFGTTQALRMFVERVAPYRPNVVLLGLFLANDLGDNVPYGGSRNHYLATRCGRPYVGLNGSGAMVDIHDDRSARQAGTWLNRLLHRSELYANLFPGSDPDPNAFADWDVFTGKHPEAVASAWELTSALLRELDRQVQAKGGRLVVLLMPHQQEVRVGVEASSARSGSIDFDRAHAFAEAFLREARIAYVDLYPSLRGVIAKGEHPYLRRDMHWNSRGHEVVAEVVRHWLVDHCGELGLPVVGCASSSRPKARLTEGHPDVAA
jgi:SGNH hydrolase-like domain, acetyltransferase AlgX